MDARTPGINEAFNPAFLPSHRERVTVLARCPPTAC